MRRAGCQCSSSAEDASSSYLPTLMSLTDTADAISATVPTRSRRGGGGGGGGGINCWCGAVASHEKCRGGVGRGDGSLQALLWLPPAGDDPYWVCGELLHGKGPQGKAFDEADGDVVDPSASIGRAFGFPVGASAQCSH